jgi:hypothetical protein
MAWKINLGCNILILFLFWILSLVAITPAYNLFVQYGQAGTALPTMTDLVIQTRFLSSGIPLIWAILTVYWGTRMDNQTEVKRNERLLLHTSVTISLGLAMLFIFSLAGTLPFLKIAALID